MTGSDLVYLDHAATTPMRPEAIEAMLPFLAGRFANPSGGHRLARDARRAVDEARDEVAAVIGCRPGEVIFTGGGTESDNAAICGVIAARGGRAVCSAAEHHAVGAPVARTGGVEVEVLVDGSVDLDALEHVLVAAPDVSVVSVMAVNNEVGTINDLVSVARTVRRVSSAVVHTDAVQAPCWLDVREVWHQVDVLSLSAHKFGGPKGVGVLVVRDGVPFRAVLEGGGQERDRRSGTHNVAGIVAMATALRMCDAERDVESARIAVLRDRLVDGLVATCAAVATVPRNRTVAGAAHVCFDGIENEALLYLLDQAGVCASAASSCAAGAMEPSHVLAAMGVARSLAGGAIRFTLGRTTTDQDVDVALSATESALARLRR